ncbi:MAG: sensor domain-containing diguanylate cyclase, partial [Myxococcales bacterium]|nr:sensor domain-containing diguanylate cyclase [Myxococcales bacterium]
AMPRALVPSPLALSGIASSPFDHVVQLQNGETVRIVSRLVEAAGAPLVVARLIPRATPRRTMQLRLDLEKQAPSFAESVDGLWEYDVATRRFYFSSRWCEMLGYEPDAIIPTIESWIDLVHPDDRDPVQRALAQVTSESSERFDAEYRMRRRTGDHIWIHGRGIARRDESGRLQRVVGAHTDITRRKETERELFFAAFHDALTGLPNRALLVERIGQSLALQQRAPERRFAVLFLDIDRFKSINDAHGHRVGDAVIIELGKRLKSCIRERDTLSRMGGDEFAVILADVAARQDVVLVAERIQQSLATHPLEKARAGCITVSIGIAINHGGYQSADEILHDADMAMYEAKSGGGSRFVIVEHPSD